MSKNKILILFILVLCLSVGGTALLKKYKAPKLRVSDSEKQMLLDTGKTFSECAGYYDAMSWLAAKEGLEETAVSFKDGYRGWYIAGAYLLFSLRVIEDWQKALLYTESLSNASSQGFKAGLEINAEETLEDMKSVLQTCKNWSDYQEKLTMELREKMADSPK